ncbi:MAG: family NAD(P)-dependent oxidoreductase [Nevskia sp.]|nr:family NAD(P)-dependent oxidoreductase [Nevskia sp.]
MSTMENFDVLGLTPADSAHPGIAVAVARSGGIGLLDLEFCRDGSRALANFRRLLDATEARVGLRLTAGSTELAGRMLALLAPGRTVTLVLAGGAAAQAQMYATLQPAASHQVLAEITDAAVPATLAYPHHGIVAKGHEAGGWVGVDTSYILLQKLAGKISQPIYVHGGIGIHSAAACRILGVAGVVVDDQLLLLAESPLPEAQQNELARLNGAETKLFGELIDAPCRVYSRPGTAALKASDEDNRGAESGALDFNEWHNRLNARLSWSGSADNLMPLGQGIGVAAIYRTQYRTVGRFVQALAKSSLRQIESAAQQGFIAPGGPLAQSHGTRYPLAQGPMTRVSDSPEFAYQVSLQGGLPFLALALMRGPQVLEMLQQTKAKMGNLPWGVGMLGFVPHSLREEQSAAIWQCKPTYALIAGGRPDQAAEFEKRGIPTYIHAPAPALLKMYIEQGAKRFVFEGRECGGHIGPLASFPLWEQMTEALLADVKPGTEGDYHLLFAGGLHDARSGAMLAALTAPLAARGMKVGGLMGTAYLFTREIVHSGAIVEGFQAQALECARTVNLESGPGHSTRCADTTFARDFYQTRRSLLREGRSADEIRDTLEDLNMGRLRIASKGLNRDSSGAIVTVEASQQLSDGMYMIGQVATLRDKTQTIDELHSDVTVGGSAILNQHLERREIRVEAAKPCDIAIVGLGTLLPKAHDADQYWHNILEQVCVLGEVPESRWDWKLYFDADRRARDKVYSRWGGFLDEVAFDPIAYGIPPKSMKVIDPMQLLTLEVTKRALADAGYANGDFDRENTSIILGAGGGLGDLGTQYAVRSEIPRFIENPDESVWERLPEWTEESFAGALLNVAAGRVANRMDFGGLNFTVDAACASSLAAIGMAVNELETGRSNFAIAGGVDTVQSPFGFLCFSKTQALSPTGKPKTFDQAADGIAISEGLAVIAMKRLADAERDGDKIYAVIKAVSGSSDGKALGMTAPRPEGQKRALRRAYARAGFSPATLGLAEAHGTGTPVGDRAEAKTITESLQAEGALPKSCAIGSVKTLLGHTKASAGVSGLIKVALSLHHRTLPAHYGVSKPIDTIADANSPVYLLKDTRPWLANPDYPRRGGVSAFGFGGTNFHAVLEEYRGNFAASAAPGSARWPLELFLFKAKDEAALSADLGRMATALRQGTNLKLRDLAYSLARQAESRRGSAASLAIVAKDFAGLLADVEAVLASLGGNGKPVPASARLGRGLSSAAPKVAFLFPGQGSQYVNMGRETAVYIEELRTALELADSTLRSDFPQQLSRTILPHAAFDPETEKQQAAALTDTRVAQPSIGTLALGYLRLAERLGLSPMAAAGHSYGEYAALLSAGVLSPQDFLRLSAVRGRCMGEAARSSAPGAMVAVQARREVVQQAIAGFSGVKIANHNSPEQSVISGAAAEVEQVAKNLEAASVRVSRLPVSGAFHTELVAGAQIGLSAAIQAAPLNEPRFPVYSNTTGTPYPSDIGGIRNTLDGHLLNSVEFVAEIEAMYAAGARVFVELGPKGTCSNMAKQTLAGRDAIAVSLDGQGGGLRGLLLGLAELTAAGVEVQITKLFDSREVTALDLNRLAELIKPVALPKHAWWVSGGCARPLDDPMMRTGKLPALDLRTSTEAREKAKLAARPLPAPIATQAPAAAPAAQPMMASQPAPLAAPAITGGMAPAMNAEALIAYQQTMRQFLNLQERVIQQYLGGGAAPVAAVPSMSVPAMAPVAMLAPTVIAAPAPVAVPVPAPVAAVAVAPQPIAMARVANVMPAFNAQAALLEIVAERTGYPSDMLGLDQDLEAELGIDSIKRVEILGAFQKRMPSAGGEAMQGGMERYTRAKTLNAILEQAKLDLAKLAPAAEAATAAPLAIVTAAPVAVAAPAMDRAAMQTQLLNIVAERTGYPTDMLGMDQDLEAELGIDSIKRVEILGALQKNLPASASEAMQAGMEQFTKARSLNAILDAALALAPAAASAVYAAPAAVAVATAPAMDRAAMQTQLLNIVAERTGYPTDMLGMDQDLEAELGIDSIKRVEILGALQKNLPTSASEAMQAGMEQFTKARSLNAILDAAMALAPAMTTVAAAAPVAIATSYAAPVATLAPAAPAMDRAALQMQLLNVVAERTGYPTDMLGMDQDLEAELGIDSIKRVEILGALQKGLPASASEAMQASMEQFTKARSLNAILDAAMALAPAAVVTVAAPAAYAAQAAVTALAVAAVPAMDRASLQMQLLNVVAERTGYPTDMLGMDQDLEAELGIDSIKRVEILGALQKGLPASASEAMQASMEQFTKARSLNAILDAAMALASALPAAAPPAPQPVAVTAQPAVATAPAKTPRFAPRARPAPLSQQRHPVSGSYLLTADHEGVAERLADRIVGVGGQAVILSAETCADAQALASTIERIRANGAVHGIVHLAGLQETAGDLAGWKQQTTAQAKTLFKLLQLCGPDLSTRDSVALSVGRLGGSFGRDASGRGAAAAGAAVGLFNCAMAEWPSLRARMVDFEDAAQADQIADALLDELAVADKRSEVGYINAGTAEASRIGFVHVAESIGDHPFASHLQPNGEWVALITGGARGITAEIAEELARPGMRLVLLGRTPLPGAEPSATAAHGEGPALKKVLLDAAFAAGRKPTPAELEREYRAVLADREIRGNITRLSATGAQVDYRTCDVRDASAFAAMIDSIYEQYGRIDAVLHGAGVIEDKRIADKTAESFDRVYDTKVDSAYVLSRRLRPDSLKVLSFFTSVAGRFGNVGQGDYGAANETLNRLAWQLHREWPGVRVVSINWGPWAAGMATDAIIAGFRSRGVEPIPVMSGRRFFLDELAYGSRNDVELVAGIGPWQYQAPATEPVAAAAPESGGTDTDTRSLPLIRRPLRIGVGGAVTLEHLLTVDEDHYLADHVMDSKPVLPAAAALEYMAQFVAAGWPEWQVAELRDVRALNGIVLDSEQGRELVFRARASTHSEPGQQAVTIELLDPHRKAACYRATAVLMAQLPEMPTARIETLADAVPMEASRAYNELLFHGPRFRLVQRISGIGLGGIDADVMPSSPRSFLGEPFRNTRWLFDPGLLDIPPQLAWVWARVHRDMGALPSRFGRVTRFGVAPLHGPLSLAMRLKPSPNDHTLIYDAQIVDASGNVRVQIIDGESTMSQALNRLSPGGNALAAGLIA